jgi:hypothetical protein
MPRPETSSTNNASCEVEALRQQVEALTLENEHLKLLVAKYRRMHFGQKAESQEQLGQLDLALAYDPLAIQVAESMKPSPVANDAAVEKRSSKRKPFPETLPRETVKYMPQATCCPDCGGQFKPLGEDVSEMLEYVPASFKVVRHVRPKLACVHCATLRRRMHRHGRFRAEWPDRPCWHTCWSGSSAITCRSIGRVPFMPGVVWAWIARCSPNGWAIAMNCCPRWSRRSGVMCWAAPRSMRMTPRYPSSLQVKAEPRPHVYGRMFGMIARLAAMILRRSGLPTPKTGRGAILANT